jgi:hypothetical protein
MHTTIYDVVNELYKAFLSDFINEEPKKADKIRKQLNRLKKEEGSLSKEMIDFTSMLGKYLAKEFTNNEITETVFKFIDQAIGSYMHRVWNDFNYHDSVDEDRAYFWKTLTDDYYMDRKSDSGEILKASENSFFALTYNLCLKKFGITSSERIEDLFKYTTPRNLKRWKTGDTLPNSYIAIKEDLETLYKQEKLTLEEIDELNFLVYFSLAISRLRSQSKKVKIYLPQFIEGEINEYESYISRIINYPSDTCNTMRYKRCSEKKEENETLETMRLFFCGMYNYFNSDFQDAQNFLLDAFELGRYHIGPWVKFLIQYLLHCCNRNDDKKNFSKVFNWYHFIGDNNFVKETGETDSLEKRWDELSKQVIPAQMYIDGKNTIM